METLLVLLCLLTTVTPLSVHKECFVKPNLETEFMWTGSHIDITVWIPEVEPKDIISHNVVQQSQPVLSLTLQFSERIGDDDFDRIAIWPSRVKVTRYRNNKLGEQIMNISTPIEPGWTDFNFTSEGQFEVWHKYSSTRLASLSKEAKIKKIFVVGSNVTINCLLRDIIWEVTTGKSKTIPLYSKEQVYQFSFFSDESIKPTINLGEQSLQVGWDGKSLVDITTTKTEYQKPLPSSVQHWFTLIYNKNEHSWIIKGEHILKIFTFGHTNLPTSLSVKTDDTALIYFHRPYPPPPTTTMSPHSLTNVKGSETGSSGYIVAIVILVILCAGFAFFAIYLRKSTSKKDGNIDDKIRNIVQECIKPEGTSLLGSKSNSETSITSDALSESRMWDAVVQNDARYMKFLLGRGWNPKDPEKGHTTTPFVEAHILGRNDILQVIANSNNQKMAIPPNDLIIKVMKEITLRMKKIFKSAAYGMYKQKQGVNLLLLSHSLPGTIRDHKGRSLLHYMASRSFMDGRPAWEAHDIEDFLKTHECYINATDHWGNTALHSLAMRRREDVKQVFWNGKEQALSETWLALAEIFLSYGCDPRINNHQGQLPHQLAKDKGNHDMTKLFQMKCDTLGPVDIQKPMNDFQKLVTAAQLGHTSKIKNLLLDHVPLLPMCAHHDPLVEAIRHRQREAVFLLLCAGSPLCNRSIEDLTPFETAHSTLGIPACFPALMRKAYGDKLASEISRVSNNEESLKPLHKGMQDYKKQIEEGGSEGRWTFSHKAYKERSREARLLLVKAAELGLSLTCQLLGLEDVLLHPFPEEKKPFEIALLNKHLDTQYVLYRDLKMSPFTFSSSSLTALSPKFAEHTWVSELMLLEEICSREKITQLYGETGNLVMQYVKKLKNHRDIWKEELEENPLQDPPHLFLYILGKYGLGTVLHTLISKCKDLNINGIVEAFSKCTLIHVASMYGQLDVIEFLIYNGANLELKTIGEFSAAHMAALRGHKECMHYVLTYMESQGKGVNLKCRMGHSAKELMDIYEDFCNKEMNIPLLSHRNALHVKNRKGTGDQAHELIKRRSEFLKISDAMSLIKCAKEINTNKEKCENIQRDVKEMVENISKQITDPRFQGEIKSVGHLFEGNNMFDITGSCVIYELSQFHAMGPSPTVICRDVTNENNETSVQITSATHLNLFNGIRFRETFCNIIEGIIAKDGDLGPGIVMIPPFVTLYSKGVKIYTMWKKSNEIRVMRTRIVPCLRVESPPDDRLKALPQTYHKYLNENSNHLLMKNIKGEWFYRPFDIENSIFSNLSDNHKTVWLSCRMILLLLNRVWWAPHFNTKRYEKPWHTMSLGVTRPEERAIKALFLEEMAKSKDWNESHLFDRIYAIFKRGAEKDKHDNWIPKKSVSSFLTLKHYSLSMAESIVGILNFFDDLKKQDSTPEVQIKTESEVSSKVNFQNNTS